MAKLNMVAAMEHRIAQEVSNYGDAWFDKERIVAKVAASYGRMPAVRGLDLNKILASYVKGRVTIYLQSSDSRGWRVFESYRAGQTWRWQRARAMDARTLLSVIDERRVQLDRDRRALERLERLYQALLDFEAASGNTSAVVGDVIDNVV